MENKDEMFELLNRRVEWIAKAIKVGKCRDELNASILELWNVLPEVNRRGRKFEEFQKEFWKMECDLIGHNE